MKEHAGKEIVSPLDKLERRTLPVNLDALLPVVRKLLAREAALVMSAIDTDTGIQQLPIDVALLRVVCNRLDPQVSESILNAVGLGGVPEGGP